jgi:hypothetical protein
VSYRSLHDLFFALGNELMNSKMFPGGPVSVRVVCWDIGEVFRAYLQALLFASQGTILPLRWQRRNHGYLGCTGPGTTGPVSRGSTAYSTPSVGRCHLLLPLYNILLSAIFTTPQTIKSF